MKRFVASALAASVMLGSTAEAGVAPGALETQGKAVAAVGVSLGDGASAYRRATRQQLLLRSQLAGAGGDPSVTVARLVCNPLKASSAARKAQGNLVDFGGSLDKLGKAAPDTLVALWGSWGASYEITPPGADDDTANNQLHDLCSEIADDVLQQARPPELLEMESINGAAWQSGKPEGNSNTTTPLAVIAVIDSIRQIIIAGGGLYDQRRKAQALKAFFLDEKRRSALYASVRVIDHAAQVATLGQRLDAKLRFRAAWHAYGKTAAAGPSPELYKASADLLDATALLDGVILAAYTEKYPPKPPVAPVATKPRKAPKPLSAPCTPDGANGYVSATGKALVKSLCRLEAAALGDWRNMSKEDRQHMLISNLAIITKAGELYGKLEKYENDKESFNALREVLDDLP